MPGVQGLTPEERFWNHVDRSGDCWIWTAAVARGYGHIRLGGRGSTQVKAHRFAYQLLVGPIPEGLDLDHLCRNRACVNPAHLEPVTRRENLNRGPRNRVTHCPRGHAYTPENTRAYPRDGKHHGGRQCWTCHNERRRVA